MFPDVLRRNDFPSNGRRYNESATGRSDRPPSVRSHETTVGRAWLNDCRHARSRWSPATRYAIKYIVSISCAARVILTAVLHGTRRAHIFAGTRKSDGYGRVETSRETLCEHIRVSTTAPDKLDYDESHLPLSAQIIDRRHIQNTSSHVPFRRGELMYGNVRMILRHIRRSAWIGFRSRWSSWLTYVKKYCTLRSDFVRTLTTRARDFFYFHFNVHIYNKICSINNMNISLVMSYDIFSLNIWLAQIYSGSWIKYIFALRDLHYGWYDRYEHSALSKQTCLITVIN